MHDNIFGDQVRASVQREYHFFTDRGLKEERIVEKVRKKVQRVFISFSYFHLIEFCERTTLNKTFRRHKGTLMTMEI